MIQQATACVKEMSLDCATGTLKPMGNGVQRKILFIAQNKHTALAGRQGGE
ncbi:MAG: hypothetical protein OXN17_19670 [Candidatus Poribacteria bacterium]|nr:hypothetical protein [Candidatus Poribacteria bacterium]